MVLFIRFGGTPRSRVALLGLALAMVVVFQCAGCQRRAPASEPGQRPVWPPPPAAPRVEYIQTLRVPRDLGIRKNWLRRFFSTLFRGRRSLAMVRPYAVAVTPDGKIAVTDPDSRCVHVYDEARSRYRRLEMAGGSRLVSPVGVAADGAGRLYVADSYRRSVFRFGPKGRFIDALATGDVELLRPTGLAFDPGGERLYVVDTLAHAVFSFDTEGRLLSRFGKRGAGNGEFNFPVAVAVDRAGRVYVTDSMNFRVQILEADGTYVGAFGRAGDGPGDFDKAKGIAVDADGHVYVVDALHDVVHVYDTAGRLLTFLGGSGTSPGRFWLPTGISIDRQGRILVVDSANRRVQILRYLGDPGAGS